MIRGAEKNLQRDSNLKAIEQFEGVVHIMDCPTFLREGEIIKCPENFAGAIFANTNLKNRNGQAAQFLLAEVVDAEGKPTGETRHLYTGLFSRRLAEYEEVTVGTEEIVQLKKDAAGKNIIHSMSGTVVADFNDRSKNYENLDQQMSILKGRTFKVTRCEVFNTRSIDGKFLQRSAVFQLDWC